MCGGAGPNGNVQTGARTQPRLHERRALHLRGVVLPDGVERDVFVVDGHFTFTEPADAETVFRSGWLIPGLVDAHAHLALYSPAADDATADERVRASAAAQLEAGVLLVREPGSPNHNSIGLGPEHGVPRVITAGRFIAPPGRYIPGLSRSATSAELPDAAEEEARQSGAWVKVVGDFFDADGMLTANYDVDVLTATVRRVHDAGARLAVHATSRAGLDFAVEAGVDSVEHGVGITDAHLEAMAGRTAFVPTMSIFPHLIDAIRSMGASAAQVELSVPEIERHPDMVRRAAEAGVQVLAGTDAGLLPHGLVADEVRRLFAAGLPAEQALGAASWTARSFLGLPGIEEAAPADLIGFPEDPRANADRLPAPTLRVLDGRLVTSSAA
jgi:imidazolonepropionase-like amidohydrolase